MVFRISIDSLSYQKRKAAPPLLFFPSTSVFFFDCCLQQEAATVCCSSSSYSGDGVRQWCTSSPATITAWPQRILLRRDVRPLCPFLSASRTLKVRPWQRLSDRISDLSLLPSRNFFCFCDRTGSRSLLPSSARVGRQTAFSVRLPWQQWAMTELRAAGCESGWDSTSRWRSGSSSSNGKQKSGISVFIYSGRDSATAANEQALTRPATPDPNSPFLQSGT